MPDVKLKALLGLDDDVKVTLKQQILDSSFFEYCSGPIQLSTKAAHWSIPVWRGGVDLLRADIINL